MGRNERLQKTGMDVLICASPLNWIVIARKPDVMPNAGVQRRLEEG
jgi:hypothetical protein